MRWAVLFVLLFASSVATLFVASKAHAQDGDGLYDRFDNDVWFSLTAAASSAPSNDFNTTTFAPELRARYLDSAGVFLAMNFGSDTPRVLGGIDLRPIFLGRFLKNLSLHRAFWDLLIDSIGLDVGISTITINNQTRAALVVGTGLDIPVLFDGYPRLSIRLGLRYTRADAPSAIATELALQAGLTLTFGADTGLAAREGPRTRR
ncbi:MAG: hypothetical protein IPK60_11300 [Sandaracinaceae bacterium]|jgi:hypothetical protein|nr:hypothetical protein [Sandaracinaceae bacterium]